MKTKKIYWGDWHVFDCDLCYDMEQRGYGYTMECEGIYFDDLFAHTLKPIKYKLVKATKKNETT